MTTYSDASGPECVTCGLGVSTPGVECACCVEDRARLRRGFVWVMVAGGLLWAAAIGWYLGLVSPGWL